MQIHVIVGALSFCIFSLGLFLGGGVRPLLMPGMKTEPVLIGPIVTSMFSRYNLVALVLSVATLVLEIMFTSSLTGPLILGALTLTLALKVAFDVVIRRREGAAQIRGVGEEGKRLNLLHTTVERATLLVIVLSLAAFFLNVLPNGRL